MDFNAVILAGSAVTGLAVGMLTGIFGVGGGFLLTPALMILLSIPGEIAVGTGLAMMLFNSTLGLIKRRKTGTVDVKLSLVLSGGSVIGVLIGSKILTELKNAPQIVILGKQQDPVQYFLLCLFGLLLVFIAGYLYYDLRKNQGGGPEIRVGYMARFNIKPHMHFSSLEQPHLPVVLLVLLGGVVGLLTGLMGIGGGVILLPALVYLVGQRTVKAAGTSLLLVWISAAAGVMKKAPQGEIDIPLLAALLAGGICGTLAGTKIGLKLSGPRLRLFFIYVVMAAVLMVVYKLTVLTFF